MESDLTVFIEFYGLPGSGKSTISHQVAEELRKRGKRVKEPTYDIDHNHLCIVRKVLKLLKSIVFAFLHPIKFRNLCTLVKINGYYGLDFISQCINISYKLWAYDYSIADYVVFDEGITQSSISLAHKGQKKSVDNESILYMLIRPCKVIKFSLSLSYEDALKRIEKRNVHESRIEKITNVDQKRTALDIFAKQCGLIQGIHLNGLCPIEENSALIIDLIGEKDDGFKT